MAIKLFEHNMTAYKSALELMDITGKAAIIHPTGTGKSFIGFKLAEDNPDKRILWLTPSEYIVKTQLENLRQEGGSELSNITFVTYARLMRMTDEEMAELEPDICITDEMHRLGALWWGAGFDKLCQIYPNMKLLGLSATHIRYLDNQRDMAQELFDGNIASEMTLGEVIVRGILQKPKYVIAMYDYEDQLDKLGSRTAYIKNRRQREDVEKKLEALRRALEMADGMDKIFERHIADKTGKYIIFCPRADAMEEIKRLSGEWFGRVDKYPNIYSVYTDNPASEQEFRDFKADNSDHLKLLFSIDMLNEGVHVEGISGVILCRPTVSPIIYKQQIGRALSASKSKDAVIFDLVNNFDGLYSVSSIEQEMEQAITYYRERGLERYIVNETFEVTDEIRDCVELFREVEDALGASWDYYYEAAKQYYKEHGDLNVRKRYVTDDGLALGAWLVRQRSLHLSNDPSLTEGQIRLLDAIGMDWEHRYDKSWREGYAHAVEYSKTHDVLDTPVSYKCEDGYKLGFWLATVRTAYKNGNREGLLTEERIKLLDELNMVWQKVDTRWEENYLEAVRYYNEHGDLEVPSAYVTENGIKLGSWVARLRAVRAGRTGGVPIPEDDIKRLDKLGMRWESRNDIAWNNAYEFVKEYYDKHGTISISRSVVTPTGVCVARWLSHQRDLYRMGRLTPDQIKKLEAVGVKWETVRLSWDYKYDILKKYYAEHGDINIPQDVVVDGVWIGKWISEQRKAYRKGKLTQEKIKQLEAVGMDWLDGNERRWEKAYDEAVIYYKHHGDLNVPATYRGKSGMYLSQWLDNQRKNRSTNKANVALNSERIDRLSKIGMVW